MKTALGYVALLLVIGGIIFAIYYMNSNPNELPSEGIAQEEPPQITNTVEVHTNKGIIELELFGKDAPKTVENFLTLDRAGFYDFTKFHRVMKGFMIQGGDPLSKDDNWEDDGSGGPGYTFEDEFNRHKVKKGVLAMANSGPNTNGSQFFILTREEADWLDGVHTVFGRVRSGMEVVTVIENVATNTKAHPTEDMIIQKIVIK